MKKIVLLLTSIAMAGHLTATTYVLTPQNSDALVDADHDVSAVNSAAGRVGEAGTTPGYGSAAVFVFALPKLAYGTQVTNATLSLDLASIPYSLSFNADLYSLGVSSSSVVLGTDYFNGAYGTDSNATAIQQHFVVPTSPIGEISPNTAGKTSLIDDLNAQLSSGATGNDYYFLRLSPDFAAPADANAGYSFDFTNSGTITQPQLSITTQTPPQLGRVEVDYWTGINNGQVLTDLTSLAVYPNLPTAREFATVMSLPTPTTEPGIITVWGPQASGARIVGTFYPTTTGTYTFQLVSNSQAALYVGSQTTPIVSLTAKNSPPATSSPQTLTAGQSYYIEAVEKMGPLDANPYPTLSINYKIPGGSSLVAIPTAQVAPPASGTAYASNAVATTLASGHPRLMISPASLCRLYTAINTAGSTQALWWTQLKSDGDADISAAIIPVPAPHTNALTAASQLDTMVYTLGLYYNLTTDPTVRANCVTAIYNQLHSAESWSFTGTGPNWGNTTDSTTSFLPVAELAQAFAVGYDWCYSGLTPVQRTELITSIENYAFTPGISAYGTYVSLSQSNPSALPGSDAWWVNTTNNWTIVCDGGLTMAALGIYGDETTNPLAPTIINDFFPTLYGSQAMGELAPDGGWPEAATYWQFVTRYLSVMMASLETSTGTNYTFDALPGLSSTGISNVYNAGPCRDVLPYGDSPGWAMSPAPSEEYFGLKYNQPLYSWREVHNLNNEVGNLTGLTPMDLVWFDPRAGLGDFSVNSPVTPITLGLPLANYFSGTGLAFLRSDWHDGNVLWVGVKAGSNSTAHTHLQAGSFCLDGMGIPWVAMLGRGYPIATNYGEPGYFDSNPFHIPNGWQFYSDRAEGSNTLVINPSADGGQTFTKGSQAATITSLSSTDTEQKVILDMTNAYKYTDGNPWNQVGSTTSVTSAVRGIRIVGESVPPNGNAEGTVQVQDEVNAGSNADINWFLHTAYYITLSNGNKTATFSQTNPPTANAPVLNVQIQSPSTATFSVVHAPSLQLPITPTHTGYPPAQADNNSGVGLGSGSISKLRLEVIGNGLTTITVSMTPYFYGGSIPTPPAVVPLSSW